MISKNKIYITSVIFGLIVLFLIGFLIFPLFNNIKNSSKELFNAKKEILLLEDQIKKIKDFEEVYEIYQPNLIRIDQMFVDPGNPADFIQFLEKIAVDSGIPMEISHLISSEEESESEPWQSVTSQISSKGSFPNFLRFFEQLEASPYLIKVQNLVLKRISQREIEKEQQYSSGDIGAICSIKVFTK